MKKGLVLLGVISLMLSLTACEKEESKINTNKSNFLITNNVLSGNYIGNGAQWGGFEIIESWTGVDDFNEADWVKLKERIDFMRPPFIRIMISAGWNYLEGNTYNTNKATKAFHRMMQYCTDNKITVMFGEWGHLYLNNDKTQINETWLDYTVDYLHYLINEKGYTCIKYYNMINEPNGDWSTVSSNYAIWKDVVSGFVSRLESSGLDQIVKVAGPDIAVFADGSFINWMINANNDFGDKMGLYEIHSYPNKSFVTSGDYLTMLQEYKSLTPPEKQIVVGEIGLKYYDEDTELQAENENRIAADPYSSDDSNMLIYDAPYGIDISDAIIQTMMAGYSGALVWNMDDAMYNIDGTNGGANFKKLKRWGFWNILGEEAFESSADEDIRPFYYPVSLLCRYFPQGAEILEVEAPGKKGLKAVAARYGGNYTIAILNSNYVSYKELSLKTEETVSMDKVVKYVYTSKSDESYEGIKDSKGLPVPIEEFSTLKLDGSIEFEVPRRSVVIFTNIQ